MMFRRALRSGQVVVLSFVTVFTLGTVAEAGDQVDKAVWVGNAVHRISSENKWEYLPYLRALANSYRKTGTIHNVSAKELMLPKLFADQSSANVISRGPDGIIVPQMQFAERTYGALKESGFFGALASDILLDELRSQGFNQILDESLRLHWSDRYSFRTNSAEAVEVLSAIYDMGQNSQEFGQNFNSVYGSFFRADIGDAAVSITRANPEFAQFQAVQSLAATAELTSQQVQALRSELISQFATAADHVKQLNLDLKSNPAETAALTVIELERKANERALNAARQEYLISGMRGATAVIGALLPHAQDSRRIMATANAAIDLYEMTQKFEAYRAQETSDSNMAIAGAAMTFNYFAIAMTLVQAFSSEDRVSPEQEIFNALVKLSEQIAEFQEEVSKRFNRVDSALNSIHSEIVFGFQEVLSAVNNLRSDLHAARIGIEVAYARVAFVQRAVIERLDFLMDQDFRNTTQACLSHQDLTGRLLTQQEYASCVANIRGHFLECFAPARSGLWTDSLADDANLFQELNEELWTEKINLLRGYMEGVSPAGMTEQRANPLCWAGAAEVYSSLASGNPKTFASVPITFLDELQSEGKKLVEDFSLKALAEGGSHLKRVVLGTLQRYKVAVDVVAKEASTVRARVLSDNRARLFDLEFSKHVDIPTNIRAELRQRPIVHIATNDEGFPTVEESPRPYKYVPKLAMVGDESWPKVVAPESIWELALREPWLSDLEMLGLGYLDITYAGYYTAPSGVTGAGFDVEINGVPTIKYFIHLVSHDGKSRKLVAQSDEVKAFPAILYVQYPSRATPIFDFKKLIENEQVPFGLPRAFVPQFEGKAGDQGREALIRLSTEQNNRLRQDTKGALRAEMAMATSRIREALRNVDNAVLLLRGVLQITLPYSMLSDPNLRYSLYGSFSASDLTFPLTTTRVLQQLVGQEELSQESLLQSSQLYGDESSVVFIARVKEAIKDAVARPQSPDFILEELSRLATLSKLHLELNATAANRGAN